MLTDGKVVVLKTSFLCGDNVTSASLFGGRSPLAPVNPVEKEEHMYMADRNQSQVSFRLSAASEARKRMEEV